MVLLILLEKDFLDQIKQKGKVTEDEAKLAMMIQVISRAVYPASELKTTRWIKENCSICELTRYDMEQLTKDKLYHSALHLYDVRDAIEKHLSGPYQ